MTTSTPPKVKTIEEILERFDEEFPDGVMEEYNKKTDTWENDITDEVKAFLRTAIIEVLESVVPSEYKLSGKDEDYTRGFTDGHKYARKEFLENIRKIKGNGK